MKKRPIGVTILSIFNFFLLILIIKVFDNGKFALGNIIISGVIYKIYYLLNVIISALLGYGLWKLKEWAYNLLVIEQFYFLIFSWLAFTFADYDTLIKIGWKFKNDNIASYKFLMIIGIIYSISVLVYMFTKRKLFSSKWK